MNYFKMFRDIGVIDNDPNFFSNCSFDIEHNCRNSSEALFVMIDEVYKDNDVKNNLSGFIWELKKLYKEVGINLGCFFIERHFNKEIRLNSIDTDKLEIKMILNVNFYFDMIFEQIGDIKIKYYMGNLLSVLQNKTSIMQHELVVEYSVPEKAINFVLNSVEFRNHSYFLIKTGFKFGFFLRLAFNALCKQL